MGRNGVYDAKSAVKAEGKCTGQKYYFKNLENISFATTKPQSRLHNRTENQQKL